MLRNTEVLEVIDQPQPSIFKRIVTNYRAPSNPPLQNSLLASMRAAIGWRGAVAARPERKRCAGGIWEHAYWRKPFWTWEFSANGRRQNVGLAVKTRTERLALGAGRSTGGGGQPGVLRLLVVVGVESDKEPRMRLSCPF